MGKDKMDIELKKCLTPKFRVSYPSVFEAKSFEDQAAKYSVVAIFDKSIDLKELKRAARNASIEAWGADPKKWPARRKTPFRDGDAERGDTNGYENSIFITASSKQRPGLVDQRRQPIIAEEDFYAGCFARATLIAFAYDKKGNKGIAFSLQNIQKMGEGERLGGRRNAEDDFDDVACDSDNAENYDNENTSDDDLGY